MTPRTLDDLLELVPGLRKCRSLTADWLRRLLDREKKQCTWCGGQVPKGRSRWCSDECVRHFRLRCQPEYAMRHITERDKGICQLCGADTWAAERRFDEAWKSRRLECQGWGAEARLKQQSIREELWAECGCFGRGRWREVDHIVEVQDGGGLCEESNLRLICGACHAAKTAARRKRTTTGGV